MHQEEKGIKPIKSEESIAVLGVRDDGAGHHSDDDRGSGKWLEPGFDLKIQTRFADALNMAS